MKATNDVVIFTADEAPKQTAAGIYLTEVQPDQYLRGTVHSVGSRTVPAVGTQPAEFSEGETVLVNRAQAVKLKVDGKEYFAAPLTAALAVL